MADKQGAKWLSNLIDPSKRLYGAVIIFLTVIAIVVPILIYRASTSSGSTTLVSSGQKPGVTTIIATQSLSPTATEAPTVTPTPIPTPTPTATMPSIPHYYEGTGPDGSPTFTNYKNAGGTTGWRIDGNSSVEVSCRVTGWMRTGAPSGDNWWYRVKSSPWNDAFYSYADNFYNIWPPSGPLINGVLVDANVPLCN